MVADARPALQLAEALIRGECGLWVGACTARWVLDAPWLLTAVLPALRSSLHAASAPLREASALALVRAAPAEAPALLAQLADDPAPSVQRMVRALLAPLAPRATA